MRKQQQLWYKHHLYWQQALEINRSAAATSEVEEGLGCDPGHLLPAPLKPADLAETASLSPSIFSREAGAPEPSFSNFVLIFWAALPFLSLSYMKKNPGPD